MVYCMLNENGFLFPVGKKGGIKRKESGGCCI